MDDPTFTILYRKLKNALTEQGTASMSASPGDATREEIDEIDQLRKMILEVIEPDPTSFTTT